VIDYLQLVEPDKKLESRVSDVGYVSRMVKKAAKDLGIHIILLAQLNRGVEQREDKRPVLSDLRDSGEIEQDADNVVFLYREEYYLKLSEPKAESPGYEAWATKLENSRNRMEMYSAKRRNGETARRFPCFFLANQAVRGSRYFEERGR
jgi:replicative DNA helicase